MAKFGSGDITARVEAGVWTAEAHFELLDAEGAVFGRVDVKDLTALFSDEQAKALMDVLAQVQAALAAHAQDSLGVTVE